MVVVAALALARMDRGAGNAEASPSLVVGVPGGEIITSSPTDGPSFTPAPSFTPRPTPTAEPSSAAPTPSPTPVPPPQPEFFATIVACEANSGPDCIGEMDRIGSNDESFVALMTFDGGVAGDVLNAFLTGNGQTIEAGSYTLPAGGRGYYYATLFVGDLPRGEYTLSAIRNGEVVASRELRRGGRR